MKTTRKALKGLCALLALLILWPAALAEGSFEAVVSAPSMNVYGQAAPHALIATLPQGTVVTVTAWSGKAALISYNGTTGIARVSDMRRPGAEATPGPQESATRTMVTNRDTRIYQRPTTASRYVSLPAGTALELLAVNGAAARVSLNGRVGYTLYAHLSEPGAVQAPSPTPQPTVQPTDGISMVQTGNLAVVTTQAVQIYELPDFTGDSITVKAGTELTLVAYLEDCAMVSRDGALGYTRLSALKKAEAERESQSDAWMKANPFATGSNEHTIYRFLTGEMGLNRAAAMGVMANIYWESGYKPVINGDSGTSYGICQWHAGRKTNLINWCGDNGLDYTTLDGQLRFLKHELPTRYPSVDKYLRQVENTADGAYDAAYYFCFNFEAPANRTAQSTKRGNYAKDTLWGMQ